MSLTLPTHTSEIDEADLKCRLAALSLPEKVALLTGADLWSLPAEPRIGLRKIVLSDGPAGVRGSEWEHGEPSMLLPCASALAATWNPDAVYAAGRLLAAQARDKGVHVLLAPTVNLQRSPRGGRNFESFSEDPVLAANMAVAYVRGVQSLGVAATVKHFAGNESETQRMSYDARISPRLLHESYLLPFEDAVREAGAWAVMAAYNKVNGTTMTDNRELIGDVLKDMWGFDGVVVSDWGATHSAHVSALAGLDLVMPGPDGPWGDTLVDAVRARLVGESVIDDKVLRLLRLASRVGALDRAGDPAAPGTRQTPDDSESQLRSLAAEASVLLRNEGILPLKTDLPRRVALIGPNIRSLAAQGGGSAHAHPSRTVSPADGLEAALNAGTLSVHPGVSIDRLLPVLSAAEARDPDSGAPGVRIEFLDERGELVESAVCDRASLVLAFGSGAPTAAREVCLRAIVTAQTSGRHQVGVAGSGSFQLKVGTAPPCPVVIESSSSDPISELIRPSEQRFGIDLVAGDSAEIELRCALSDHDLRCLSLRYACAQQPEEEMIAVAVAAARDADIAVIVVGTTEEYESEGFDRDSLALPGRQDELVRQVAAANSHTIVVVNAGAPVLMPWIDDVAAVLWIWLPGQEGGAALADVLIGACEPGGRMPASVPATEPTSSTMPVDGVLDYNIEPLLGYRALAAGGEAPAVPFGHGLGYTQWRYDLMKHIDLGDGTVRVEVDVTNTGARAGREIVQCYLTLVSDDGGSSAPCRLAGFAVVQAGAGERQTVRITLDRRCVSQWDVAAAAWALQSGRYRLAVGRSSADIRLRGEVIV